MGSRKQKLKRRVIIIASVILAIGLGAFIIVMIKDQTYHHSAAYRRDATPPTKTAVIYFSRSGNTEAFARSIARATDAKIIKLHAPRYSLDFSGWYRASRDAQNRNADATVKPARVELGKYKLVFLGSPIWFYRPSPPLWTFVKGNDFRGTKVVLFNTFNSRFKAEHIDTFKRLIEKKGGQFIDHIHVRRGRVPMQKSESELISEFGTIIKGKIKGWRAHLRPAS